ncbi:hypothetical protein Tco_0566242 [Tanacetum coccineum]
MNAIGVWIEAPSELPQISLVNESLQKLKYQLASFDNVAKKRATSDAITAALKNELRKLKGKNVVDIVVSKPSAIITPRMFNKKDAHEVYLEKTIENTDTLCGLVECARKIKPTTSASGSKPSGNTKNNRITRPSSSNQKNKVEEHPRKVKSSLNKITFVSEPISNAHVKHYVRNAKFESICPICTKCLFDASHDICVINYVNDVNCLQFELPEDVVNKTLRIILELQFFKSSPFDLCSNYSSKLFSNPSYQQSNHIVSDYSHHFQLAIYSGVVSPLATRKVHVHGRLKTISTLSTLNIGELIYHMVLANLIAINGIVMPLVVAFALGSLPLAPRKAINGFEKSLPRVVCSWTSQSLCLLDMVD